MGKPSLSEAWRGRSDWRPLWDWTSGQLAGLGDVVAGATDKRDVWAHRPPPSTGKGTHTHAELLVVTLKLQNSVMEEFPGSV
jgi:hypothetical protein